MTINNLTHRGFSLKCIMLLALLACIFSCKRFVEVDLPTSQLNTGDVFNNKQTATAAQLEIYSNMRERGMLTGNPAGLSNQLGLYTDELTFYGIPASNSGNFYNNLLLPSLPDIKSLWENSYNQIYAANAVIGGVDASSSITQADKDQLKGEALFVRALIHFYLVNCFGDVPYVATTNYIENSKVKRTSISLLYQHVKDDLKSAVTLLSINYPTAERVRPNKAAAQAMLARVCLYMQQWEEAQDASSSVISQTNLYKMPDDMQKTFLKESLSTIWQLMPALKGGNTIEGSLFVFEKGPPPSAALTKELLNAFDPSDLRRNWIREVSNGATSWFHSNKYKQKVSTATSMEYSIVLRLAEQFLIRAEAKARLGDVPGAQDDINVIRAFAGLGKTNANTPEDLLTEILLQRRLEFFCEFGHRFFDLKRNNLLNSTLQSVKPGWKDTDKKFPLPESELLLNLNLAPQNDGY